MPPALTSWHLGSSLSFILAAFVSNLHDYALGSILETHSRQEQNIFGKKFNTIISEKIDTCYDFSYNELNSLLLIEAVAIIESDGFVMTNRGKKIARYAILLVGIIVVFNVIDALDVGSKAAALFGIHVATMAKVFSSIKTTIVAIVAFIAGKAFDIVDYANKYFEQKKASTPSITIEIEDTSAPRFKAPSDAENIISLGSNDKSNVYVQCSIKNKGITDIPNIRINNQEVLCNSLQNNCTSKVCLKIPPKTNEVLIDIECQNNSNVFYCAQYRLKVDYEKNSSSITNVKKFKESNENGKHAKNK